MPSFLPSDRQSLSSDFTANFGEMLRKVDQEFARLPMKSLERFYFSYDGIGFDVRRVEENGSYRFLVNATVGYIPFSIESSERREAIKAIIIASRSLPVVRFGVDTKSKISACAVYEIPSLVSPDFIFYPLVLFMQEARPFIRLIGKYLFTPTPQVRGEALPVKAG